MKESITLANLGLPLASPAPFRVNSDRTVAEGSFHVVLRCETCRSEFFKTSGLSSEEVPLSTRIFDWQGREGDEVIAHAAENRLPLLIRRAGELVVNFDILATQAFQFDDTKRPIYTYVPGFNVHKVPATIRRPLSNLVQSLRSPRITDVVSEYSKLPLTGFELVLLLLNTVLGRRPASEMTTFTWPGGKRAAFVALHDIDTVGFLKRRERDSLFRVEQKHGIKATWFVPTAILKGKDRVDFLLQSGNEVGWHDHFHDHRLPYKPFALRRAEILKHSVLADMGYPLGMRTPKLMKSNHLFEMIDQHCPPLRYDTSFLRGIAPYPLWLNGRQSRILEIPTTVPTDIRLYNQLSGVSGARKYELMLQAQIARTKKLIEVGALISIVTHPEKDLSERPELLEVYDKYLAFIKTCPELWIATAGEVYTHWTKAGARTAASFTNC